MSFYEKLKQLYETHKQNLILAVSFVLIFIAGFGTGRVESSLVKNKTVKNIQQNYTTNTQKPQNQKPATKTTEENKQQDKQKTTDSKTGECVVKGNISSKGVRTYHVKGGAFYNKTNPEQCFQTESEALAAGFKRSSR